MSELNPIKTNTRSNNCGEPVGSDCVILQGVNIPGTCGNNVTLTQGLNAIQSSNNCCTGSFPPGNVSGYTGNWIDFSAGIPLNGTGVGYIWSILNFGTSFNGVAVTGVENNPSYYWTQTGDLKLRGSFTFSLNPTIGQGGIAAIPLLSLSSVNFPTNFNASQSHLVGTTASAQAPGQQVAGFVQQVTRAFMTIDYPSGILYLNYDFVDTPRTNITENIFINTIFNLA